MVRNQTYKATPMINDPAVRIVRSVSMKPSRRVNSTQSYDSGIGDTIRPPLPVCRPPGPGGSADNVFLGSPELTKKTTFGELYEQCPDDTPLFVDIPYSRPVYFSAPATNDAEMDRTLVSDVQPFRQASFGFQPKSADGVGAATTSAAVLEEPFEVTPRRTVDSGFADLGENIWLMDGKKVSEVCSKMLTQHQPKKISNRILKDQSKVKKSRKTSDAVDN